VPEVDQVEVGMAQGAGQAVVGDRRPAGLGPPGHEQAGHENPVQTSQPFDASLSGGELGEALDGFSRRSRDPPIGVDACGPREVVAQSTGVLAEHS